MGFKVKHLFDPFKRQDWDSLYWSSTNDVLLTTHSLRMHFSSAEVSSNTKAGNNYVRCVRGGKGQQESKSESSEIFNKQYFTIGSTKDEVLAIQGQPTHIYESFWMFGSSVVHFEGNRVLRWEDFQANLKVKLK
jgi:hypothetical protein